MRPGRGEGRSGQKKRISDARLLYVVLDYLVLRREGHRKPCTAYDIAKNAPRLTTTQRQQRIEAVLELLEERELVKADRFDKATYYSVTDGGMDWYKKVAKEFWSVLERTYDDAPRS